jgi:hypothetical protein
MKKNFKPGDLVMAVKFDKIPHNSKNFTKAAGINTERIYIVRLPFNFNRGYSYTTEGYPVILLEGMGYSHLSSNFIKIGEL